MARPNATKILLPYLREGLSAGEKCICVLDAESSTQGFESIGAAPDLAAALADQLEIVTAENLYLRRDRFSAAELVEFWQEAISALERDGRFNRLIKLHPKLYINGLAVENP